MPSPVTMPPRVLSRKTRLAPPVAMITDLPSIMRNSPVDISMATTPWQRPSSTSRSTQKNSSKRLIDGYLIDVWKSVCRMWKPGLSAANQVRSIFIPPKARTLTCPSFLRLHGQPQCSSWVSSTGACSTKYSTTSCSHSQSPPPTVSWKCRSRLSSGFLTPAAPLRPPRCGCASDKPWKPVLFSVTGPIPRP